MFNVKEITTRTIIIAILTCFSTFIVNAQDCTCLKSFNELRLAVEKNYAGIEDKVNKKTKNQYQKLLQNLKNQAIAAKDERSCYLVLKRYKDFFKDEHLYLEDILSDLKENISFQDLPSENLETYFKNIDALKDIRGIYTSENYELAVVPSLKEKNTFVAIIISSKNEKWKKGMIKMVLKPGKNNYFNATFLYGDFSKTETEAYFSGDFLDVFTGGTFQKKLNTEQKQSLKNKYQSVFPTEDISFSFPDDKTAVLFLGSFGNPYEKVIDSLMTVNKTDLEKRPNWIIDLRYNGGGGTGTYRSLLPYLYTNPIKRNGSFYWLSEANTEKYANSLIQNPNWPQKVKAAFENYVKVGKQKPNSWHFEAGPLFNFDKIEPNPKKIAILVSKKTASSGEIFLMDAKQSKKVTIFGSYSAGVVDYGDGNIFEIGCSKTKIQIPVRRSEYLNKEAFDNIGIKPDVICDPKDALKIALKHFDKK